MGDELMNMKTMARKREGDVQVESYHWAGWENANIFCSMIAKSRATWCTISKLREELCKMILTLLSMIPVGVCGEVEDVSDVDSE